MKLAEIICALGRPRFEQLIQGVSMGSLRTYQVFDSFKVHARMSKLSRDRLRRAVPRLWDRLSEGDEDLAQELAQGVLVSNLTFVAEVLDFLEIPHDGNGFFAKNSSVADKLNEGWQERVVEKFRGQYPEPLILLYVNHLDWELADPSAPFLGEEAGRTA